MKIFRWLKGLRTQMGRPKKHLLAGAARARSRRWLAHQAASKPCKPQSGDEEIIEVSSMAVQANLKTHLDVSDASEDDEVCSWIGGVNHCPSDVEENIAIWVDSSDESDGELSELEGDELKGSLGLQYEQEVSLSAPYQQLSRVIGSGEWKKAEMNRGLGYHGRSDRTKRWHAQKAREKDKIDAETQN